MKVRSAIVYPERQRPAPKQSLSNGWKGVLTWLLSLSAKQKQTAGSDDQALMARLAEAPDSRSRQRLLYELADDPVVRAQLALQGLKPFLHHLDPEHAITASEWDAANRLLHEPCLVWPGSESRWRVGAMAAAAMTQAGIPVQLVHATQTGAQEAWLLAEAFYRALGIEAGLIQPRMSANERCRRYAAGLVHVSISELMLDYLRDRRLRGAYEGEQTRRIRRCLVSQGSSKTLILPGLEHAILIDGRSLLCESALTSVVASDRMELNEEEMLTCALAGLAGQLQEARDYRVDSEGVALTGEGRQRLLSLGESLPVGLRRHLAFEHEIVLALSAFRLLQPGQDYRFDDGQLDIREGLVAQADLARMKAYLAIREGYRPGQGLALSGRLSYRRFLQRYRHLSALLDRGDDIADEIQQHYGLSVITEGRLLTPVPLQVGATTGDAVAEMLALIRPLLAQQSRLLIYAGRTADEALPILSALDESGIAFDELTERAAKVPSSRLGVLTCSLETVEKYREGVWVDWPMYSLLPLHFEACHWMASWDTRPLSLLRPLERRLLVSGVKQRPLGRLPYWLLQRAFKREANEQRNLRQSMMAADEQYRRMLSFTGTGE